ncbi:hypothetical protein D049_1061 [Vibrio parahaemolyticus VPTS-2010]|nr:hypothetical protein D049_1061 [Vibrio parahaemolyticus VPTS-2010]
MTVHKHRWIKFNNALRGQAKQRCLILCWFNYLYRYNESTLDRMRTEYVTPLMG